MKRGTRLEQTYWNVSPSSQARPAPSRWSISCSGSSLPSCVTNADCHDADVEHTHADTTRARELLGYEPTHTLREGSEKFIAWYWANREWYEPPVRS